MQYWTRDALSFQLQGWLLGGDVLVADLSDVSALETSAERELSNRVLFTALTAGQILTVSPSHCPNFLSLSEM
jgi:hypothetical protein